jgi:CTP:molybdopterin cytidylyltransferase MocA
MTQRARVAGVVLAAGGSSRLRRPKQLVLYEDLPLVVRAARTALATGAEPVVMVLGAHAEEVRAMLSAVAVTPVVNSQWNQGMGTSVATGVKAVISQAPSVAAILIMLADQPLVSDAALRRLIKAWSDSDPRSIAAAAYADTFGVPAVFGRSHFQALCSLPPAAGAARVIRQANSRVRRVAMPEAALDIDTPGDVERLMVKPDPRVRSWQPLLVD